MDGSLRPGENEMGKHRPLQFFLHSLNLSLPSIDLENLICHLSVSFLRTLSPCLLSAPPDWVSLLETVSIFPAAQRHRLNRASSISSNSPEKGWRIWRNDQDFSLHSYGFSRFSSYEKAHKDHERLRSILNFKSFKDWEKIWRPKCS